MVDGVQIDVKNLGKVNELINKLPEELARKAYRQAGASAMKIMQDDAKSRAPVKTGRLRDSIKIRTEKFRARGGVRAQLYVDTGTRRRKGAPHAHLVEYGTDPHQIPKRGGGNQDQSFFIPGIGWRKRIQHPGAKAKPFIRPAFDATKNKVHNALEVELGKSLDRQVNFMRRKLGIK